MRVPLVSVMIPVYNGEAYLRDAIDSILTQSHSDFELIVVNDGSTDRSSEIAWSYSDPRLRVLDHHHSFLESLNAGLALARGRYIARQDADDIAMPERLARQVAFMEANPDVGLVGGAYVQIGPDGEYQRTKVMETSDVKIKWLLLFCNQFRHTTVMWRGKLTEEVGGYREIYGEDYDLWSRMAGATRMTNLTEPLAKFRVWRASVSATHGSQCKEVSSSVSRRNVTEVLGTEPSLEEIGMLRMIHSSDSSLMRLDLLDHPTLKLSDVSVLSRKIADRFVAAQRLSSDASEEFNQWVNDRMSERLLTLANYVTEHQSLLEQGRRKTLRTAARLFAEAVRARPRVLAQSGTWRLAAKVVLGPVLTDIFRRRQVTSSP